MHRIIKPTPISDELPIGAFIRGLVRSDDRFTLDFDGMKAMESIVESVDASEAADHIDVEDAAWEKLVIAAKKPTMRGQSVGYGVTGPVEQVVTYLRAIVDAQKVKKGES